MIATETRPLLQGARLTVWELQPGRHPAPAVRRLGRPRRDGRAAWSTRSSSAPTGSPRTATPPTRSAPTRWPAPPPGTGIPFVVVAPQSTVDAGTLRGDDIPIEERDADEVIRLAAAGTTVPGTRGYNPAFDVTPADLITAIVTEQQVWRP